MLFLFLHTFLQEVVIFLILFITFCNHSNGLSLSKMLATIQDVGNKISTLMLKQSPNYVLIYKRIPKGLNCLNFFSDILSSVKAGYQ